MAATITPATLPQGARSRKLASTMLLSQWLAAFRAATIHIFELPLGPTPHTTPGIQLTPQLEGMLRRFNVRADAISISPTEIEVIECAVVATSGKLSQVEEYASLITATPALAQYRGRAIVPALVFGTDKDYVRQRAVALGVRYYVFTPAWIAEYLVTKYYQLGRSS